MCMLAVTIGDLCVVGADIVKRVDANYLSADQMPTGLRRRGSRAV